MICEHQKQTRIADIDCAGRSSVLVGGVTVVRIDRTPQPFGGSRAWFLCPSCDRRCAVLYPVQCRACLGLGYASERLSPADRATLQSQRHRRRLGQDGGSIAAPLPSKPKWMRWHTYLRMRAECKRRDARHIAHMVAAFPHPTNTPRL